MQSQNNQRVTGAKVSPVCLFFSSGARQDSLPEKLAVYEKNIDEFDAFVDMLQ